MFTHVLLRRPTDAPLMPDAELDAPQGRHIANHADLRREGVIVANGPLSQQFDVSMRGLSIFACYLAEAARLSDGDSSVQAGQLA